jgi:uracil phosphoribosyltransferase
MLFDLAAKNTIAQRFVAELRDVTIQQDRARFRRNLERIGEIMAYEISQTFDYQHVEVTTPLGKTDVPLPRHRIVLATILRAGLPLHHGLLHYFDDADNAFISAYRHHLPDHSFEIRLDYLSTPRLDDAVLILADPMLASGSSIIAALRSLSDFGKPFAIHIVSAIASRAGIENVQSAWPEAHIWAAAIDAELNAKAYIVPGLGDAGDLAFGLKI